MVDDRKSTECNVSWLGGQRGEFWYGMVWCDMVAATMLVWVWVLVTKKSCMLKNNVEYL